MSSWASCTSRSSCCSGTALRGAKCFQCCFHCCMHSQPGGYLSELSEVEDCSACPSVSSLCCPAEACWSRSGWEASSSSLAQLRQSRFLGLYSHLWLPPRGDLKKTQGIRKPSMSGTHFLSFGAAQPPLVPSTILLHPQLLSLQSKLWRPTGTMETSVARTETRI